MGDNYVLDFFGVKVYEGDIIVRAKHSDLCYHKVLKITNKSIKVSIKKITRSWAYNPNRTYSYTSDTFIEEGVSEQNSFLYISKHSNIIKVK